MAYDILCTESDQYHSLCSLCIQNSKNVLQIVHTVHRPYGTGKKLQMFIEHFEKMFKSYPCQVVSQNVGLQKKQKGAPEERSSSTSESWKRTYQ